MGAEVLRDGIEAIRKEQSRSTSRVVKHLPERVDVFMVARHERHIAGEHLPDKHTQRPPIDSKAISAMADHLGCHVVGCATEGESLAVGQHLREAKINNTQLPRAGEQ